MNYINFFFIKIINENDGLLIIYNRYSYINSISKIYNLYLL